MQLAGDGINISLGTRFGVIDLPGVIEMVARGQWVNHNIIGMTACPLDGSILTYRQLGHAWNHVEAEFLPIAMDMGTYSRDIGETGGIRGPASKGIDDKVAT